MQRPKKDDVRYERAWRQGKAAHVENINACCAKLATKADQIAATIPYLSAREARKAAIGEFLATWLQILRGEWVDVGGCP